MVNRQKKFVFHRSETQVFDNVKMIGNAFSKLYQTNNSSSVKPDFEYLSRLIFPVHLPFSSNPTGKKTDDFNVQNRFPPVITLDDLYVWVRDDLYVDSHLSVFCCERNSKFVYVLNWVWHLNKHVLSGNVLLRNVRNQWWRHDLVPEILSTARSGHQGFFISG